MTRWVGLREGTPSKSPSVDILLYYKVTDALVIRYYLYTMTPTFAPLPVTAPVEPSDGTLHPNNRGHPVWLPNNLLARDMYACERLYAC